MIVFKYYYLKTPKEQAISKNKLNGAIPKKILNIIIELFKNGAGRLFLQREDEERMELIHLNRHKNLETMLLKNKI